MSRSLEFLYGNPFGRLILKAAVCRPVSKIVGAFMDSRASKVFIKRFIRSNGIDLSEYEKQTFDSFNDCFTRKIKPELRPIDGDPISLVAPCDGRLTVIKAEKDRAIPVKQSVFTLSGMLKDEKLAKEFEDGLILVFRLCVDNYHRYCYFDSGKKGENVFIKGKLHTVQPVALERLPVFTENCREYTVMETESFGKTVQCEVGALLVGKIKNREGKCTFVRGEEKGMFLYGGSTVILLLKKDAARIDHAIVSASDKGIETPVKMGMKIGEKI